MREAPEVAEPALVAMLGCPRHTGNDPGTSAGVLRDGSGPFAQF